MTGLLTFITDEYKKHWKAFCIISASYALFLKLIYEMAVYLNYYFMHLVLIFVGSGFAISMIYSVIIQGKIIDIKTIFKKYIKISLYMLGVGVISMVLLMIGMLMLKPVINNTFLMILSISLIIVYMIFFVYIAQFSFISCVKYDMSAKKGIKKACKLLPNGGYKAVVVIVLSFIPTILGSRNDYINNYIVMLSIYVLMFPLYNLIIIHLYNICDHLEESDKNTIFKKIFRRVF